MMGVPALEDRAGATRCVFGTALLARSAECECAGREARGEQLAVSCNSPGARTHCVALAALLQERARFALRLPPPGRPLRHAQALRLQCGGLAALLGVLGATDADVHRGVVLAQQRYGSLAELPWAELVAAMAAWQPPSRQRAR